MASHIAFAAAIYVIVWMITLFVILPIGITTHHDSGDDVTPGATESAPVKAHIGKKMLATTILASLIFAAVYYAVFMKGISLDDIPFLPRYDKVS